MDLDKNSHGIRLTFEMMVTSDFDMDVNFIIRGDDINFKWRDIKRPLNAFIIMKCFNYSCR